VVPLTVDAVQEAEVICGQAATALAAALEHSDVDVRGGRGLGAGKSEQKEGGREIVMCRHLAAGGHACAEWRVNADSLETSPR
jgi:hypothetical protein